MRVLRPRRWPEKLRRFAALIVLLAVPLAPIAGQSPAGEGVVFDVADTGPPTLTNAYHSDFDSEDSAGIRAVTVILTEDARVNRLRWYGAHSQFEAPGQWDHFRVRIYGVVYGVPDREAMHSFEVGHATRVAEANGFYRYDAHIPAVELEAGTYVVSVVNDTPGVADWYWGIGSQGGSWERCFSLDCSDPATEEGELWLSKPEGLSIALAFDWLLHDNGDSDLASGSLSELGLAQQAEVFDVIPLGSFTELRFKGFYRFGEPGSDNFYVAISNADEAGPSEFPKFERRFGYIPRRLTGRQIVGPGFTAPEYEYVARLPDVTLGDHYLEGRRASVAIHNDSSPGSGLWYWAETTVDGTRFSRPDTESAWSPVANSKRLSFALDRSESGVVHHNGGPLTGWLESSTNSAGTSGSVYGDLFSLDEDTRFDHAVWFGEPALRGVNEDDFLLSIYEVSDGSPAASPVLERELGAVGRGLAFGAVNKWEYWKTFPEIQLQAGEYFLTIVNRGSSWYWTNSYGQGGARFRNLPDQTWQEWQGFNVDMAYTLSLARFEDGFETGDASLWLP